MSKVNQQFDKLFISIKDRSYPTRAITVGLWILFPTFFIFNILRFVYQINSSIKLIYFASNIFAYTYEVWFSVMFTLFMMYLADIKYIDKRAR